MPASLQLHQLKRGQKAIITQIGGSSALRRRFVEMGIVKGETILLLRNARLATPWNISSRAITWHCERGSRTNPSGVRWGWK